MALSEIANSLQELGFTVQIVTQVTRRKKKKKRQRKRKSEIGVEKEMEMEMDGKKGEGEGEGEGDRYEEEEEEKEEMIVSSITDRCQPGDVLIISESLAW